MFVMRVLLAIALSVILLSAGADIPVTSAPATSGAGGMAPGGGPLGAATVQSLGAISPSRIFSGVLYSTGGTALRNQSEGAIIINGNGSPPPPAVAAFLYWAVITTGAPGPLQSTIRLQKLNPARSDEARLRGSVVGSGDDPCWDGDTITVFRASIPVGLINVGTGSHAGVYKVRINCEGASSCLGEDPWSAFKPAPLWEGASLVILFHKPGATTSIYDVGLAGNTFSTISPIPFTYTLVLPTPTGGTTWWDNIGADGQRGGGRTSLGIASDEITVINGLPIAGPGSSYNDSDWNGNDGNPLPMLWDTTGHDISAVGSGVTSLGISFDSPSSGWDCLTPIANVVGTQ